MRSKFLLAAFLIPFLTLNFGVSAWAQYTTGTIAGTVTDPTGASISGVTLVLTSQSTNESRTYTTGRAGDYVFPALAPGSYVLTLNAPGFNETKALVSATTSATVTQNFSLKPGSASTIVQVDATASVLNTSGSELSTTRTPQELAYLPSFSRSPTNLVTLEPGVTPMYLPDGNGALVAVSGAQTGLISAFGSRARATAASLDYTDVNDWEFGGFALGTSPTLDMISETKVITGVFPAEYGVESSNIVLVTKSGSNHLHGSAYDYIQNNEFNARDYFDTTGKPSVLKQNIYGFTLGGPVWRDHTFLFGGLQKVSTRGAGSTFVFPVPTAAALAGATDPLALQLFQANVPLPPNAPAGALSAPTTETMASPNDSYLYLIRGDHRFSEAHSIAVRYLFSKGTAVLPYAGTINFLPGFGVNFDTGAHSVNITDTYLLGSNKVNELRVAYGRSNGQFDPQDTSGIPRINFADQNYSFGEAQYFPQGRLFNVYQINDTFSWVKGRHSLKFGADVRYIQDNSSSTTSGGIRGTFTFAPSTDANGVAHTSLQNFLSGTPASWSRVFGATYEGYRMWVPGFFAQDEWKIQPTLTLNYGIRYEVQGALNEVHGLISELDPNLQGVNVGAAGSGPLGAFRSGNPGIAGNYKNFSPRVGFSWNPSGSKTTVRGGYGVYFDTLNFALLANTRFGPPLNYTVSLSGGNNFANGNTFDNLVNGAAPIETSTAAQIGSFGSLANFGSITSVARNLPNPYTQNYSLGVVYLLGSRTALSADYLGSVSRKLTDLAPINSVAVQPTAPTTLAQEQACIGTTAAPGPCTVTANGEYGAHNNRIDPRFDQVDLLAAHGSSNYNAVAVQIKQATTYGLEGQLSYTYSKSLDDDSDYNLAQISNEESYPQSQAPNAHNLEYGPSDFDITHRITLSTVWAVPYAKNQQGLVGHLLGGWVFSTLDLWQTGAPATIFSGARLGFADTNLDGNLIQTTGMDNTRASINPGGVGFRFGHPSTIPTAATRGIGGTANTSNFKYVQPLIGNIGTLGRNTFRMNSLPTVDWSLSKNTRIFGDGFLGSGPWNLEIRADAFNIFNIPFLTAAGNGTWNNLANPSFGQYNTAGSTRKIQLSAKINF
ncbi:TonB-dependent receptor [Granulicella sp. L60]|uniref:TonB-dependent receptor n=1 Tax=Granulicella sp. L60 TaxID=1641866 RepID=UPI00131A843A|nr:TonB-dependent receptor [Granulicella sp. L60]